MPKTCEACGNNHAPHWVLWIAQTATYISGSKMFARKLPFQEFFVTTATALLEKLHLQTWRSNLHSNNERTLVVLDAASKKNIELQQQYILGGTNDTFRYRTNSSRPWREFYSLPSPIADNELMRGKLNDKWQTKQILESIHAKTSHGFVATSKRKLLKKSKNLTFPLVVKPAHGSRGRHTTILIKNTDELVEAFYLSQKICFFVLCEEMLHGSVYRFTTINGKSIAILRGDYPQIIGNGRENVAQLVSAKNRSKPRDISEIEITPALEKILAQQNLNLQSIPKKGQVVLLGSKIGIRYGGDAIEVTPEVHLGFLREIDRIAKKLPLFTLGFDVIAEDISKSPDQQKWGIIEINTTPFIQLHHSPRLGKPVDVAGKLWEEIIRFQG